MTSRGAIVGQNGITELPSDASPRQLPVSNAISQLGRWGTPEFAGATATTAADVGPYVSPGDLLSATPVVVPTANINPDGVGGDGSPGSNIASGIGQVNTFMDPLGVPPAGPTPQG
jgi:hypothetical protein